MYSLKQIPIANSLKTSKHNGSHKKISGAGTFYQLPVMSNPREKIKRKMIQGQKSSFESSLGSLNNQFLENGVYNKLNFKIRTRKTKENVNFLNRASSFNDTVSVHYKVLKIHFC